MARAVIDGVGIEYDVYGEGPALVWLHEHAGDRHSWRPQIHFFSRRCRVITLNARGYPPSDVPEDVEAYSQQRLAEDVAGLLDHLGIEDAYVGGQSIGAATALQFGLLFPQRTRGMILSATGAASAMPDAGESLFLERAAAVEADPGKIVEIYGNGAGRRQLRRKDPLAWQQIEDKIAELTPAGTVGSLRGVLARRPAVFELEDEIAALDVPALILVGDEDELCIEPSIRLKRLLPRSGLMFFPQSGHSLNLEEPGLFNRAVFDFINAVEAGTWATKGPRPRF